MEWFKNQQKNISKGAEAPEYIVFQQFRLTNMHKIIYNNVMQFKPDTHLYKKNNTYFRTK
ncbi:MAG: hypothetical protein KBD42_01935 [Chitinophagales bacterium]|jgi:hypothetical protein|nr:hypothetical protein [Chitinophagales bacterium]